MRRNNLDICADLLNVARTGSKKTGLVYGGNLNFKIIKPYLKHLMDSGFLVKEGANYFTTDRGIEFLDKFNALNSFVATPVTPVTPEILV